MGRVPKYIIEDRRESVRYYREQGWPLEKIAKRMNCPLSTIRQDCVAMDVEDLGKATERYSGGTGEV